MLQEISDFINTNKVASVCGVNQDLAPYCFNCFYSFDLRNHLLFFKSSSDSYHSKILVNNPKISGTILPNELKLLAIQGIQFTGTILYDHFPDGVRPDVSYHKTYPFALARPGHVWCIELETVKMTDNTRIFGRKIEWLKQPC